MTPHFVQSQEEAERLIGLKARLLKLNVKQTKRLKIGKIQSDAGVIEDDKQMEVEHFKYLGSLKSADGNCSRHQLEWPRKCSIYHRSGETEE